MNELVWDPAPRFVPTKFDRDPIRTAPGRAVRVWGNARPPARQATTIPLEPDSGWRVNFWLRTRRGTMFPWYCMGIKMFAHIHSYIIIIHKMVKYCMILYRAGLGSNTFYQIQIQIQIHFFPEFQIQIQIHRQKSDQIQIQIQLIKYKYKYTMRPKQNCRHFTDDIFKFIVL